jgi:hypothetical protein
MADEQRPSPFGRSLSSPEAGSGPFTRSSGASATAVARPTEARPVSTPGAAKPATGGGNLPMGFMAGLVAAAVGAGLWAVITVVTNYQIGWMAVGVGALVGVAVRMAGKGTTKVFGITGAVLALAGCLIGNLLTGSVVLARQWDMSLMLFLSRLTPDLVADLMKAMFDPIDLLFYALAIWTGYRFSIVSTDTAA